MIIIIIFFFKEITEFQYANDMRMRIGNQNQEINLNIYEFMHFVCVDVCMCVRMYVSRTKKKSFRERKGLFDVKEMRLRMHYYNYIFILIHACSDA